MPATHSSFFQDSLPEDQLLPSLTLRVPQSKCIYFYICNFVYIFFCLRIYVNSDETELFICRTFTGAWTTTGDIFTVVQSLLNLWCGSHTSGVLFIMQMFFKVFSYIFNSFVYFQRFLSENEINELIN